MLNDKSKTTDTDISAINDRIEELATHALPAAVIPAELAPFVPRLRAILGEINTLATEIARLQDRVCPEHRPAAADEANRWLDGFETIRGDLARILAGRKSCDEELQAALDSIRDGDARVWLEIQRHIIATAHADGFCPGGVGSFHTGGDGSVLSAIGEAPVKPRRKPGKGRNGRVRS